MTLTEKLQQIQKYADDHKTCSESLQMQSLVGAHVDVLALARALGVAVGALSHYNAEAMRVGSTISPRHADKALAEIEKLLEAP